MTVKLKLSQEAKLKIGLETLKKWLAARSGRALRDPHFIMGVLTK